MLHIGVGGFFRAHQAVFTEDALTDAEDGWGIVGASLKTDTAERQLAPQQGLYSVSACSDATVERRVIGVLKGVITASTEAGYEALLDTIASPQIQVITLTVTEKGYCHQDDALNLELADIQHDLEPGNRKTTLPGILVAGLQRRRDQSAGPLSVLSCDNIRSNGHVLAGVVRDFAARYDEPLLDWINGHVTFPCTMVDRIVPYPTEHDSDVLHRELGVRDHALVVCEPFRQWVIEDHFAGERPAWERAGALLVSNVEPYELAKLRLLNGTHSAAAYIGLLAGHEYVHEVITDAPLRSFLQHLVKDELQPTLAAPAEMNVAAYIEQVFARFANSAVPYGTRQVATDGSQKLPQRLVPAACERLEAGLKIDALALVFAAWLEHLNNPAPDPMGEQLSELHRKLAAPEALVTALFEQTPVLDALKPYRAPFSLALTKALGQLRSDGLRKTLRRF